MRIQIKNKRKCKSHEIGVIVIAKLTHRKKICIKVRHVLCIRHALMNMSHFCFEFVKSFFRFCEQPHEKVNPNSVGSINAY